MRRQDAGFLRKKFSLLVLIVFLLLIRNPIGDVTTKVLNSSFSPQEKADSAEIVQVLPTATYTPTPTLSPTPTLTPSPSPSPIPTDTPTPTPTISPSPTIELKAETQVENKEGDIWEKLAQCESGGNWGINTGNGYFGGLQFSQGAWDLVNGVGNPSEASKEEQIERGKQLQTLRGWGVWGECAKNLGLD
jgi:hypothetical protein